MHHTSSPDELTEPNVRLILNVELED